MGLPKIARIAYVVAFVMAGLAIISGLTQQIVSLPFALIPLIAGIGIVRKRVWSAYGFALLLFTQLLLLPLLLFRSGNVSGKSLQIIMAAVLTAALAALFLFAGRSLTAAGPEPGWAFPWIALSALLTLPLLFVQAFVMPTGSMEDTLLIGDHILVQRFPKTKPVPGDLIVFAYPIDRRQTFVKRVIGVGGDRIRISRNIVYRNETALQEPYAIHKASYPDSYRDNFPSEPNGFLLDTAQEMLNKNVVNGEVVVPAGKYFVLGDNRDNSLDSRYWGFVDTRDLIGKPLLIYDSEDQSTEALTNQGPAKPHRTRWDRLFKLL
jgi:signal peptidase I